MAVGEHCHFTSSLYELSLFQNILQIWGWEESSVVCGWISPRSLHTEIKKNTYESVLMRWMKLEPIIQSEVSQKEKHPYSILDRKSTRLNSSHHA